MKQFVVLCVLALCGHAIADIGLDLQGYNYDPPPNPMYLPPQVEVKDEVVCPPLPPPPPPCPPPPPPVKCPVCPPPPPPVVCPAPPPPPPPCNCEKPNNEYLPPPNDYLPPNKRFRKL